MNILLKLLVLSVLLIENVYGHGMMLSPVGRASRWRYGSGPPNYNDNQCFCGGFYTQWELNGGNCGYCGDDWSLKAPRPHEHGGTYGTGVIVASYKAGSQIPISIQLTANHKGYFYYQLCNMDAYGGESNACFSANRLKLTNGATQYSITTDDSGWYNMTLQLPSNVVCNHCVLQWTYNAGNNWGTCANGSGAMGCGAQENFRSCADIKITK